LYTISNVQNIHFGSNKMMPTAVVHNAYTPREATEQCSRAGVAKANMRLDKMFFSSFMAGCILAFACAATLSTNTSPWYQENAPGLMRMIGAVIFPWGLATIVLTGADLCTGSFMFTTISVLHRRLSPLKLLIHWTVTFFGNLAGSLLVVGLMSG
jgi:formate/nitrite transporter FocA (FNT family)